MLSDDLKAANKIKVGAKIPRYDCTEFGDNYEGIKPFINQKGMFKLFLKELEANSEQNFLIKVKG